MHLNILKFGILLVLIFANLRAMTLEEQVGQLLIVHFNGTEVNEEAHRLAQEANVGGFIYFNWGNGLTSPEQVRNLSNGLQGLAKVPLWICLDQEGGKVVRLKEGFVQYPGPRELAQTTSPEEAFAIASQAAEQLKGLGINMNLAPVVDISTYPEKAYITPRAFGNTPEAVIAYAKPVVEAYRQKNVLAVLKHFPGYGDVVIDPHAGLPRVSKSLAELEQWEFQPYVALQPEAIMSAHILLPALDTRYCATLSKTILQGVLRNKLKYNGLVLSDSLAMQGLLDNCDSVEEAAILAVNAGCDLVILGGKQLLSNQAGFELTVEDVLRVYRALLAAVKEGRISHERLEEAVERSLTLKRKYGRTF